MSTKSEVLYQPVNHSEEQTWEGFSWPGFFFGPIWLLIKGLWGHAILYVLVTLATLGFGAIVLWFLYGFMGNGLHKSLLLKRGYLTKAQLGGRTAGATNSPPSLSSATTADPIQRLKDLADLRDRGVLSESEFQAQKAKVVA
jgi:hypothetical protein